MAFVKRLDQFFPTQGIPQRNDTSGSGYYQSGVALSGTAAQTTTFPTTSVFPYGFNAGRARVKIYNGAGTSPTVLSVMLTCTDGTNTVNLATDTPAVAVALGTTGWYEHIFDFVVDSAGGTVNGGAVGLLITGGATTLKVITTLGGTSPTASMDAEICVLI